MKDWKIPIDNRLSLINVQVVTTSTFLAGQELILSCSVANPFTVGHPGGLLLRSELISPVSIDTNNLVFEWTNIY